MGILEQFGIEGKLLIVQFINFAILAVVVWKFILPRVTDLLDKRQETIKESLAAAEQARAEAEQAEADRAQQIEQTKAEADRIIAEAKEAAKEETDRLLAVAKADADKLAARTRQQLGAQQQAMRAELRAELTSLTVATTRKVLSSVVTPDDNEKMVKAAIKQLKGLNRRGAVRGRR